MWSWPAVAGAAGITQAELIGQCLGSAAQQLICEIYLRGAFDGIIQASKMDGVRRVCPDGLKTPAQLREYYIAGSAMADKKYDNDLAIYVVIASFAGTMECKGN